MTTGITSVFAYRALRPDGSEARGSVLATSRASALDRLAHDGLLAVDLREDALRAGARTRLPLADAAQTFAVLASLLESGMPLHRAFRVLATSAPPSCRAAIERIAGGLPEGIGLVGGAERLGLVAPDVLALLRAGEASGSLAASVRRAAQLLEERAQAMRAMWSALAYPALLLVSSLASVVLLAVVVLPRFAVILADLGQELPPATRLVLSATAAARAGWAPMSVLRVAAALAVARVLTAEAGRERVHAFLLHVPLVGTYRMRSASARVATTLAALLDAGVPLGHALRLAADAGGDVALRGRLLEARELVVNGSRLSYAVGAQRALSTEATQMIAAGEESGRLAELLVHAGRLEAARAQAVLTTSLRVLEPALIVAFGLGVATIAAALLQAVYAIRPSL